MTLSRSFYSTQTTAYDYLQARAPRELWAAVLKQAIADATVGPSVWELPHKGATIEEINQFRRELRLAAEEWIADETNEPRRFVWVCEQLDLDPGAVRAAVEAKK